MRTSPIIAATLISISSISGCSNNSFPEYRLTISQEKIQTTLENQFPVTKRIPNTNVDISLNNPKFTLPENDNKVKADFDIEAKPVFNNISFRSWKGRVTLLSELRYERKNQGESGKICLEKPTIKKINMPGIPEQITSQQQMINLISGVLFEKCSSHPIYTFENKFLGRFLKDVVIQDGKLIVTIGF